MNVNLDDIESKLTEMHYAPYYAWIRQLVALASGALTILVAFKSNYAPVNACAVWLLKLSWASFGATVLVGMIALKGESATFVHAIKNLRNVRTRYGDHAAVKYVIQNNDINPPLVYVFSATLSFLFFSLAVLALTVFALQNI